MISLFKKRQRDKLDGRLHFDEYKRLAATILPDAKLEDGIGFWYINLGKPMEYQIIQVRQFPRIIDAVAELHMWAKRLDREHAYMKQRMEEPE